MSKILKTLLHPIRHMKKLHKNVEQLEYAFKNIDQLKKQVRVLDGYLQSLVRNNLYTESNRFLSFEKTASALVQIAKENGISSLFLTLGSSLSLMRDGCFAPVQEDIDFAIFPEDAEKLTQILEGNPRFLLTYYNTEYLDISDKPNDQIEVDQDRVEYDKSTQRLALVKYFDALTLVPIDIWVVHKFHNQHTIIADIPWFTGKSHHYAIPELDRGGEVIENYRFLSAIYPKYFSKMDLPNLEYVDYPMLKDCKSSLDRWYKNWESQKMEARPAQYYSELVLSGKKTGLNESLYLNIDYRTMALYSNKRGKAHFQRYKYPI